MTSSAVNGKTLPTLHLLNKPPSHPRFRDCLGAIANEDSLLLMESAVIALADATLALPANTRALRHDCLARGLDEDTQEDVELVDVRGMVELTDRFPRVVSW